MRASAVEVLGYEIRALVAVLPNNLSTIEARVMASREEQWRKMQSDVVDSWRSALTYYGTYTLRSKDGQLSPVDINEQNSTPDAPADISHGYLYRTKGDQ